MDFQKLSGMKQNILLLAIEVGPLDSKEGWYFIEDERRAITELERDGWMMKNPQGALVLTNEGRRAFLRWLAADPAHAYALDGDITLPVAELHELLVMAKGEPTHA